MGGYFSRFSASCWRRSWTRSSPPSTSWRSRWGTTSASLRLCPGSVAVVFDFRRYELTAKQAAAIAKGRGAKVVVITDPGLSPATESADVVLPVPVDGLPFDSVVGTIALVEALVEAVLLATGDRGIDRMKQWETRCRSPVPTGAPRRARERHCPHWRDGPRSSPARRPGIGRAIADRAAGRRRRGARRRPRRGRPRGHRAVEEFFATVGTSTSSSTAPAVSSARPTPPSTSSRTTPGTPSSRPTSTTMRNLHPCRRPVR